MHIRAVSVTQFSHHQNHLKRVITKFHRQNPVITVTDKNSYYLEKF